MKSTFLKEKPRSKHVSHSLHRRCRSSTSEGRVRQDTSPDIQMYIQTLAFPKHGIERRWQKLLSPEVSHIYWTLNKDSKRSDLYLHKPFKKTQLNIKTNVQCWNDYYIQHKHIENMFRINESVLSRSAARPHTQQRHASEATHGCTHTFMSLIRPNLGSQFDFVICATHELSSHWT